MGISKGANCRLCGYVGRVFSGGTRSSYKTHMLHPILCHNCDGLRHTNTLVNPRACEDCGSGDILLYGKQTRQQSSPSEGLITDDDDDYYWSSGLHLCPSCKKYGLEFDMFSRMVD